MIISFTLNGRSRTVDIEPATLVADLLARDAQHDRNPCRLRHQPVRRLRRAVQWRGGQELHLAGADAGWRHADDHRGTVGTGRLERAASDAAGVSSKPRPAMRLLHAGHGDDGGGNGGAESGADRGRRSPRPRRQHLPLHRLSEHRGIGACRRGGHERNRESENSHVEHHRDWCSRRAARKISAS